MTLGHKATLWFVGAIAGAMFVSANLPWQLDDYDQAKQAYTSFEMVKAGHWLYQHTPHERIATKPPLVGWISAGLFGMTRSWDLAWRLPSLGAAVAVLILLFQAGSVYGTAGGLTAMSAFAFNLLTPRLASLVRTDMPLALAVTAIGLLVWQKVRERQGWQRRDRIWLFALLTAAMLIKGPIVYAFLFPGMLLLIRTYRAQIGGGDARGCGWWPWVASLLIFLLWVIAGGIWVPKFYDQVVAHEFLGRFGQTEHRPQPFYFYWPHVLHKFAPWSVLMIALTVVDLRTGAKLVRFNRTSLKEWWIKQDVRPETLWLVGWALGGLVVMSIIPSKRVDRIFPVIPPLCLLLAAQLQGRYLRWATVALLFSVVFAGGYYGFKIRTGYRDHRDALVKFGRKVREEAEGHHWRYEVVEASDEGLLLYLDKLHFVRPETAVADLWDDKTVDALVVPRDFRPTTRPRASGASFSLILQSERWDEKPNYVLIARE